MRSRPHQDVLVVGAGPVGMTAALLCADRHLTVRIIDAASATARHGYSSILHARTLDVLGEAGMADDLRDAGLAFRDIVLHESGEPVAHLTPPSPAPFALAIGQDVLEGMLLRQLARRGVQVEWSHRLSSLSVRDPRVEVVIEELPPPPSNATALPRPTRTLTDHASFVIGADGHDSTVRRLLQMAQTSAGLPEVFAFLDLQVDSELPRELHIELAVPTLCLPLDSHRCRWSFLLPSTSPHDLSRHKARAEDAPCSAQASVFDRPLALRLLAERAPWFRPVPTSLRWSAAARFDRRLVTSFGKGRCWLAGDAAHLASPLGSQSVNLGIAEVDALVSRIVRGVRGKEALGSLASFDRDRLRVSRSMLGVAPLLASSDRTPGWARRQLSRVVCSLPASGDDILRLLAPLGFVRAD